MTHPAPRSAGAALPAGPVVAVCMGGRSAAASIAAKLCEAGYMGLAVPPDDLEASCRRLAPAAALLDGSHPLLEDFSLLRRLRAAPGFDKVLVAYARDRVDIGYMIQAMRAGADIFLFAPVDVASLIGRLREHGLLPGD